MKRLDPDRYIAEAERHLRAGRTAAFELAHTKAGILLGQRDEIRRHFGAVKANRLLAEAEDELDQDERLPVHKIDGDVDDVLKDPPTFDDSELDEEDQDEQARASLRSHRATLAQMAAQRVYVTCIPSGVTDHAQEMARSAVYKASVDHGGLKIGISWFTTLSLADAQRSGATVLCNADERLAGMTIDGGSDIYLNREFALAKPNSVYEIAAHEARHIAQHAAGMPKAKREQDAEAYARSVWLGY